ncbi:MAG TPA: DUF3052 domain-containing protein [Galbitalea sp.]|nr:DUF3052 domain-containing protein [Galbitalea sp.]
MDSGPSGTPQLKKLDIVSGARWHVDAAPAGWRFETPPDASLETAPDSPADVVIAFVTTAAEIRPSLERLEPTVFPAGALWVAWPRKAAGHVSDITDNVVREAALARSLVDTKVAAIDADWSGLKLVWRVEARR